MKPIERVKPGESRRFYCGCGHATSELHNAEVSERNRKAAEEYKKNWKPFADWCPASPGGWSGD